MCTAVTGKGKVSKNLWFQNTTYLHRRTGRGGEGGCSPPKFWAIQIFWAARENLGKASFTFSRFFLLVF